MSDWERASWHELLTTWHELGEDERRVLLVLAQRLHRGMTQYGRLGIAKDERDFVKEAHEEFLDASVYLAVMTLKP